MIRHQNFFLATSSAFIFCLGFFSHSSSPHREPAQTEILADYSTYESIPCPSVEEIEVYNNKAHFKDHPPQLVCDGSYWGKTLKIFKLASLLKMDLPQDWARSHEKMLVSPLDYISETTPMTTISNSNPRAIASNYVGQSIHLGPAFFELTPLKALEVLIHENRHSWPMDPAHTVCRTGDIAKTDHGCDEEYSKGVHTGAYSAGTMWSLAHSLYGKNLSEKTRQELMNSALSMISTRFNKVPEGLAVPLDLLFILAEDQKIYQVHPFTFELKLVPVELQANDGIERIQYDPLQNGFLAFTTQGKMIQISSHLKNIPYYSDLLPPGYQWIDSTKVFTASAKNTPTYFVSSEGGIFMKEFAVDKVVRYLSRPSFLTKKIVAALSQKMILLSIDGGLFNVDTSGKGPLGRRPIPFSPSLLSPSASWVDASGGSTYDDLYAVNATDGALYFLQGMQGFLDKKMQLSDFKIPKPLMKFQEGMNIKMGLSDDQELFAWDLMRSLDKPWKLPLKVKVKDFAIGRNYTITSEKKSTQGPLSAWSLKCQVQFLSREPWLQSQMGLSSAGALFFEGMDNSGCVSTADYYKWLVPPILIRGTSLGKTLNYFSQTYLELQKKNGEVFKVLPYHLPVLEY